MNQVSTNRTEIVRLNEFEGTIIKSQVYQRFSESQQDVRVQSLQGLQQHHQQSDFSHRHRNSPGPNKFSESCWSQKCVYLQWAADEGNDPVKIYSIEQWKNFEEEWQDISTNLTGEYFSYDIFRTGKYTAYQFRITVTNSIGNSEPAYSEWNTTIDESPGVTSCLQSLTW